MSQALVSIVTRLRDVRLIRYILASVGALAVDVGSLVAFMALGVAAAPAAATGYSLGILAHWLMSSRAVFQDTVAQRGVERTKQKALFVISALVGLGITTAIMQIGEWAFMHPLISKAIAIVVSFTATWILRSKIVFRAEGR